MGKIYKCDLLSITKDIKVDKDKSKRENIRSAETEVVETVMVERTLLKDSFKELITGKIIPAYCISTHKIDKNYEGATYHYVPKKPYFIKYHEEEIVDEYQGNDLQLATADELEEYVAQNMPGGNFTNFSDRLDKIFKIAETYYNEAESEKLIGSKARIRSIKNYIKEEKRNVGE